MLTIRAEQMAVMAAANRPSFIAQLSADVREHFAKHCEVIENPQLLKTVALGVEIAAGYGLDSERDVFLYLCLMFMLGSFFDVDPQLSWAAQILTDGDHSDSSKRIDALYDRAMDYLDSTAGTSNFEHLKVLLRVRDLDLARATDTLRPDVTKNMIAILHRIHPRKAELLGDDFLGRLVFTGSDAALKYGLSRNRGRLVYLLHLFLMGIGFDRDPQFPWTAAILNTTGDEDEVAQRLYAATTQYLNRTLSRRSRG